MYSTRSIEEFYDHFYTIVTTLHRGDSLINDDLPEEIVIYRNIGKSVGNSKNIKVVQKIYQIIA